MDNLETLQQPRANGEQLKANSKRLVLIMAGGAGTRFWPASRESKPKQFLDILGTGKSLLRQTFERCLGITTADRIFVVTNAAYTAQVLTDLPELNAEQVFPEPSRNNTAPCIAYATLKLRTKFPDAVCLVAPSDHLIADEATFIRVVESGMQFAQEHAALVTLGMTPTRPDTGYGYVQFEKEGEGGIHRVLRFTEKPDAETAQEFLASGDYLWNSGMFIWSIRSILDAFQDHAPGITALLSPGEHQYFTPDEPAFLAEHYPNTEKISIDYAILERASNVSVIPASFGWSDLGTWPALYEHKEADASGNVTIHGPVMLDQCSGTLVHTIAGKLVVASGLEDFIVVNDDDVVLIFPKDQEQEVKRLREALKEQKLNQYL